ncbi:MAG: hypothetical protein ACFFAN_17815, partial [Promethearchaeota archaeon]
MKKKEIIIIHLIIILVLFIVFDNSFKNHNSKNIINLENTREIVQIPSEYWNGCQISFSSIYPNNLLERDLDRIQTYIRIIDFLGNYVIKQKSRDIYIYAIKNCNIYNSRILEYSIDKKFNIINIENEIYFKINNNNTDSDSSQNDEYNNELQLEDYYKAFFIILLTSLIISFIKLAISISIKKRQLVYLNKEQPFKFNFLTKDNIISTISAELLDKLDILNIDENKKIEFLMEILLLSPDERNDILEDI